MAKNKNETPEETGNSSGEDTPNEGQENTNDETGQSAGTDSSETGEGDVTPDTPQQEAGEEGKSGTPDTSINQPPSDESGEFTIFSEKRKGKTITAVTGKPIVFNNEGMAKVSRADAEYLKSIPGFEMR
ncbi:MAG: hypothetical protein LBH43_15415 [Treponema sp.]|jgi:hypothetical protein|nr:hypothetical protein [Treponema sp.]